MQKAILKVDFETVIKKGKEVPRFKKGKEFYIIQMDMFWMTKEEKGGIGVSIGPMDYLRLTYPDGSPTKYFELFDIVETDPTIETDDKKDEES